MWPSILGLMLPSVQKLGGSTLAVTDQLICRQFSKTCLIDLVIIGESNIWRLAQKCYWWDFRLVVLNTVWKEAHSLHHNGSIDSVHLIWQSL